MPKGHDPDPVGQPWPAVIILVVADILTVGVAIAPATFIFAAVLVASRAAASGSLRKL